MDLNNLLLCLDGLQIQEIEDLARREYQERYITSGHFGLHKTHDGEDLIFFKDRFEHAFYTTSDWRRYPERKDVLATERIARIPWIGELVAGNVPGSACWELPGPTGRKNPPNRLYVIHENCFVVWLEPREKGGWKFSSAYTARVEDLRRYSRLGRRIWVQK